MKFKVVHGQFYSVDTTDSLTLVPITFSVPPETDASHAYFLTERAISSIEAMQNAEYREHFNESKEDEGIVLKTQLINSKLSLGLYDTALRLHDSDIYFYVDDSDSMEAASDVFLSQQDEINVEFKARYDAAKRQEEGRTTDIDTRGRTKKLVSKLLSRDDNKLTRWGEAANRLFVFINELTCLPSGDIEISFFNRKALITMSEEKRRTLTLEAFKQSLFDQIWAQFSLEPDGGTPLLDVIKTGFTATNLLNQLSPLELNQFKSWLSTFYALNHKIRNKIRLLDEENYQQVKFSKEERDAIDIALKQRADSSIILQKLMKEKTRNAAHVLLTDGYPSDCHHVSYHGQMLYLELIEAVRTRGLGYGKTMTNPDEAVAFALNRNWMSEISAERSEEIRQASESNVFMMLSCTSENLAYFDTLDADSLYVDSMDDFRSEQRQVREAHGPEFPYTSAVWVLKQLVGSKSKLLDALDEKSKLFKKDAYESFTGYQITAEAFANYVRFKQNLGVELTWVDILGNECPMDITVLEDVTLSIGGFQGVFFSSANGHDAGTVPTTLTLIDYHEPVQGDIYAPPVAGCCNIM